MLLCNKKHLKAKQYQCITIDEDNHLIKPIGNETEIVDIDHAQLITDFAFLIREYEKCPHLRVWPGPMSYKGISDKKEKNRIYNHNSHIYEEQIKMREVLLKFVNKYGLFGLMNDNVSAFDYGKEIILPNGLPAILDSEYPEKVVIPKYDKDSPFTTRSFKVCEYEEYIKPYFPNISASEAVKLKDPERTTQYAEYMEDILQNKRILACVEYIAGIDKQHNSPLIIQGLNAVLSFKGEEPVYDIHYRSLIEYCHSMFFLNEIGGKSKEVRICQYRLCHKPHFRNSKYCTDECRERANKGKSKKKGDQSNG